MNKRHAVVAATGAVLAALAVVTAVALRPKPATEAAVPSASAPAPSEAPAFAVPTPATAPQVVIDAARRSAIVGTLGWGKGPSQIGLPPEEDESSPDTPLRFTADSEGNLLLLDHTNGRLLRMTPDGRVARDVKVPIENPRDVAIAKGRGLAFLDDAHVTLTGPDGTTRGKLPVPPGTSPRSVFIDGNDVYVESKKGTLTRVGDVGGVLDPNPTTVPGQPTRDGRGFLNALITSPERGTIHVFVLDRATRQQRFSREISMRVLVDGIFLVDTDRAGTIYLAVTGNAPGGGGLVAQLLCLEPEHGEPLGAIDLPIDIGPEAVVDAKVLDSGGAILSIFTKAGLRIERHDCPTP